MTFPGKPLCSTLEILLNWDGRGFKRGIAIYERVIYNENSNIESYYS